MYTHPETFPQLHECGNTHPPYRPTFNFPGKFIDSSHRRISRYPLKDGMLIQVPNRRWFGEIIPGWLRPDDALKLYELAYYAADDVLEFGCYFGLSTSILSRACRNSRPRKRVHSVDLDHTCVSTAQANLRRMGLHRGVTIDCSDAATAARKFAAAGRRFGFVFIDHCHAYQPVYDVCRELDRIVLPGAFCLFHDFNDIYNRDPDQPDYGVYQAVMEGLDRDRFEFCGVYGCTGLYQAREETPAKQGTSCTAPTQI